MNRGSRALFHQIAASSSPVFVEAMWKLCKARVETRSKAGICCGGHGFGERFWT